MASTRVSRTARAAAGSVKFFAYVIITMVVLYTDIMFVSLMWKAFPGGFLTILAIGGAFATGLSIIALMIGKNHWFRPGGQLIWAWCFTVLEIVVSILNVLTSVLTALNQPLGGLSSWIDFAPATPVVALVGWIIILYLDRERAQMHEQMEMDDDIADAEREHKRQVHAARMDLKATALEQQKEYLKMHLSSADVQRVLSEGSYEIARGIVSEIIQRPIMPARSAAPRIIDSTAQRIDTPPQRQAPRRLPPHRTRKFTPAPSAPASEERHTSPLAKRSLIKVKKNQGPYIVNRKQAAPLKLND